MCPSGVLEGAIGGGRGESGEGGGEGGSCGGGILVVVRIGAVGYLYEDCKGWDGSESNVLQKLQDCCE